MRPDVVVVGSPVMNRRAGVLEATGVTYVQEVEAAVRERHGAGVASSAILELCRKKIRKAEMEVTQIVQSLEEPETATGDSGEYSSDSG